jgi:hypothetical protein
MENGLACRGSIVPTHIESIGLMGLLNDGTNDLHRLEQLPALLWCGVGPGRDVTLGNKKRVSRRNWKSIPEGQNVSTGVEDPGGLDTAERTDGLRHRSALRPVGRLWTSRRPSSPASRHAPQRHVETRRFAVQDEPHTGQTGW